MKRSVYEGVVIYKTKKIENSLNIYLVKDYVKVFICLYFFFSVMFFI